MLAYTSIYDMICTYEQEKKLVVGETKDLEMKQFIKLSEARIDPSVLSAFLSLLPSLILCHDTWMC
jgi:hypothetical protein